MLRNVSVSAALALVMACAAPLGAQVGGQAPAPAPAPAPATPPVTAPAAQPAIEGATQPPPGYLIGPDDVLGVVFWEMANHGGEVTVRPDGKITLPLINDIQAAGLTPDQLRVAIVKASAKFIREPDVTVVVKAINSLKVFVTGQVNKPGTYPLTSPTTVLQVLALAGGVGDFAKKDRIVVMRTEGGETRSYKFNYKDVIEGKKLEQNIPLRPGDTVVVP